VEATSLQAPAELVVPPHRRAIEHVIEEVSDRLDERFSLEDLASLVFFSPYHFHRIFRHVTGIPPGRFFSALRIEAAKRLLLTSDLSVTEVCLEVGYQSLGSFASQFSRLVGVSPRAFRNLSQADGAALRLQPPPPPADAPVAVTGRLELEGGDRGRLAAVGLFRTPLAEGRPVACTLAGAPGRYEIRSHHRGSVYVLAASLEPADEWLGLLLEDADLRVASGDEAVRLHRGGKPHAVDLVLRPRRLIDPPILVPPALLALAPEVDGKAVA
jgi:AraC family transcriptional regulator